MPNEYVAITTIRNGEPDGSLTVWEAGEDFPGDVDVDEEFVQELWSAGALAVKGSAEDPTLLPSQGGERPTTPAMVQDVLQAQARALESPSGEVGPELLTQPNAEAAKDPKRLLGVDRDDVDPAEAASHTTADAPGVLGQTGSRTGHADAAVKAAEGTKSEPEPEEATEAEPEEPKSRKGKAATE